MTTTATYSSSPWQYEYNPYTMQTADAADREIPAFRILDAEGNTLFDTNEGMPSETQEANACLASAAPEMLAALRLAQQALNTAPRFRVGDTDSYKIAATVDRALARATGQRADATTDAFNSGTGKGA